MLDAAVTLDARVDYQLTQGGGLYLVADNLFDEDVQVSRTADDVAGFGPPQSLRGGISLSW